MKIAVIETGGKQYLVKPSDKLKIEKLEGEKGAGIKFDKVLLTAEGDAVSVGKPYVTGAIVEAKVLRQARDKKILVMKYRNKTRYRRKHGHRQEFTEIEITKI